MSLANNAVSVGVAATLIVVSRSARRGIVVQNLSVNDVYVGHDNTVTTANSVRLRPGESESFEQHRGALWGIATGAASDVRYQEEF